METPVIQKTNIKLIVQSLDDNKMEFDLPRKTNILTLKQKIVQLTSIPFDRIRLIYKAKVLLDDALIENTVSEDNEVIHLIAKISSQVPAEIRQGPQIGQPTPLNPQNQPIQQGGPINFSGTHIIHPMPTNFMPGNPHVQMHNHARTFPTNLNQQFHLPNLLNNLLQPQGPNLQQPNEQARTNQFDVPLNNTGFGQTQAPLMWPPVDQTNFQGNAQISPNPLHGLMQNLTSMLGSLGPINFGMQPMPGHPQFQNISQQIPQNISQQIPQNINQQIPQNINQQIPQNINQQIPQNINQQIPQQTTPPQPNPVFVNVNQRPTQVSSVSNEGIQVSLPTRHGLTQQLLNTQILRESEEILRESSQIELEIPRRIEPKNSATMIGNYLETFHGQISRFLPNLKRCAKILKGEQRIRNPQEREKATKLIKNVGRSFKCLQKAFEANSFLENFEFKNSSGQFEMNMLANPTDNTLEDRGNSQTVREEEEEERRVQDQRRQLNNLTQILATGVPTNTSLSEMTRLSGENEDKDLLSIVLGSLDIADNMELLMQGSMAPLDRNFQKIKESFQNVVIDCGNKDESIKLTVFKNDMTELSRSFTKHGGQMVYPGFEPEEVLQDTVNEYYPKFKAAFLDDYTEQRPFSVVFGELLKLYYGKIAFELSEGLEDGISSFHHIFKKGIIEFSRKVIGMDVPGLENLFENKIWKHIFEGYLIHKRFEEESQRGKDLLRKLKAEKDDDENLEHEPLSEEYLKGKFLS